MRRTSLLVAAGAVLVVVALIALVAVRGGDGSDDERSTLPAAEGRTPPVAYRIVYRVTTPDAATEEEVVVRRPFGSHVVQRDAEGRVTAERWSALGRLVTRSADGDAVAITTAVAPAAGDLRPDRFRNALADAGRLTAHDEVVQVEGRACRFVDQQDEARTAGDGPVDGGELGSIPVVVARCVDDQGLVLEERWTTVDQERVLTRRAVELEIGDGVPAIELPEAVPLPDDRGNGAIRKVRSDEPPPYAEVFATAVPDGFTHVGRYAVVPARITAARTPATDVAISLTTDVWRRGADVVLLDQGAARGAAAPFDPATRIGEVDLGPLGRAELAVDLRAAEVRLSRPGGGFVRLSGTVPLDDLLELALTLRLEA